MKWGIAIILVMSMWVSPGRADYENIELLIQISTTLTPRDADVVLDVENRGSVQVLDIQTVLHLASTRVIFPARDKLLPGEHHRVRQGIVLPAGLRGRNFIAPVFVTYSDHVGVRTTTVALADFRVTGNAPKLFELSLESIELGAGCSDTVVDIKNLQFTETALELILITPPTIIAGSAQRIEKLPSLGESRLTFSVCNDSGLKQGVLPFYAIATSRQDGRFTQDSATANIHITQSSLATKLFGNQQLVSGLAFGALWVLLFSWIHSAGLIRIFRPNT